jgi:anaphase-promoting complex subunit 2
MPSPKRISTFTVFFHQLLHSSLPPTFPIHLRHFLTSSLAHLTLPHDDPADADPQVHAPSSRLRPKAPSPHFSRLGILPRYSATLNRVAHQEIQKIAREEASKGWDVRYLAKAHKRVGEGIAGWLNALFEGNEAAQSALRSMFGRMDYSMCKCFFDIRYGRIPLYKG